MFLQKHDGFLAETIKAKKQSIETKTEVIRPNKLTDRPLFQRGTSHQSKVCGGQIQHLIGFSVNVNIFSLRRIDPFHKKSSLSTLLSTEVLTHFHPFSKTCLKKYSSNLPSGKRIKKVSPCMENTSHIPKCLALSK